MKVNIDKFKSLGPDGLYLRVLKEQAVQPLKEIFQSSWSIRELPEDWTSTDVVPMYKKGKKLDPENYRPSITGKILEKIIKKSICEHLQ